MKKSDVYTTICLVLSSVIGAGFVGGNELERYFGTSVYGVIIFAVMLFVALISLTSFCKKHHINSLELLAKKLFRQGATLYLSVVSLCLFGVIIALFSTTSSCLSTVFGKSYTLPIYQIATGIIIFPLVKIGKNALEIVSKILLPICLIFIVSAHLYTQKRGLDSNAPNIDSSLIYSFFNLVPLMSVFAKNKPSNAALGIAVALLAVVAALHLTSICGISGASVPILTAVASNKALWTVGAICIYLSGACSILLCSIPVCKFLQAFSLDKETATATCLTLAVSLSNFGFEKTVEFCYPIIALVGVISLCTIYLQVIKEKIPAKSRQNYKNIGERARIPLPFQRKKIKRK